MTDWQCHFCDGPIDPTDEYVWQGHHVFARSLKYRASGKRGGSDVTLREPLEEFAHPACVIAAQTGRLRQESLL